jgi:allantoin racemase
MRIKAITPIRVTDAELARRQVRYRELAPAGIEIDLVNLPDAPEVPRRLDTAGDIAASDLLVAAEVARTDPADHDAVLPDCVLDPGVTRSAGSAPVPVYGILQLAAGFLGTLGHRFAAMTRNEPIAEELRACLRRYRLEERFDDVAVLDLTFDDIEDDSAWNAAIDRVRDRFADRGVTSVVNGCSAVKVHDREASVTVVDPTRLALQLLAVAAGNGLATGPTQVLAR